MLTLPTFIPLSEAARKSFLAAFGEVPAVALIDVKNVIGYGGPKKKEGAVYVVGNGSDDFRELLPKRIGILALPPEPQDEANPVIASVFPAGVVWRKGEVVEEEIPIQQQIANGRKGERKAELCGGTVGKREQISGIDAAAIGGIEVAGTPKPVPDGREVRQSQIKPQMSNHVKVVDHLETVK